MTACGERREPPLKRHEQTLRPETAELMQRLAAIVGPAHAPIDPAAQLSHLREWRELYARRTAIALKPGSVEEVSRIFALAHAHALPVVPQGGNSGLVGGQTPMHSEILLSLSRLTRAVDGRLYDGGGWRPQPAERRALARRTLSLKIR